MLGPFHNAPKTATIVTLALFALTALVAISNGSPNRQEADAVCEDGLATCGGATYEKLICDDPVKLTKCFDARTTCSSWNVCDCCSPVPLHKCLSPLAGRAFGADCSSPIDAREQCCGDSTTHRRSFQALADLQTNIENAEASVAGAVSNAESSVSGAVSGAVSSAQALASNVQEQVTG
uniref:Uncharacterized protein n=1 Tax=Haptolina brevifila TaxID=156173 RepID=A0A7S2MZW4_9EUKA|mmetsp:Transcript_62906/g.124276  ORF Transcript_62906/g.124276 Transcript_62906/m.124276 type:complete len:179 (+) Transcript_62906:87-623(+)